MAKKKKLTRAEELKQLALDIHHGLVFTSGNIKPGDLLTMVFMPLAMMNPKQYERFLAKEPWALYEYYEKAMRMGVNGYPMFMSFSVLTREETKIVDVHLNKLWHAEKAALG